MTEKKAEPNAASRLERFIEVISPGWALRRNLARWRHDLIDSARAYEAANPSRLYKRPKDSGSPDMTVGPATYWVRLQARHLDENDAIAKTILNVLVSKIVGRGIQTFPQVRGKDGKTLDAVNKRLAALWDEFADRPEVTRQMNLAAYDRLACRAWLRDGEVFGQRFMGFVPGLDHASPVLLSLDLIESDFCPLDFEDPKERIRQGVKRDAFKRPLSFFFFREHPAETYFGATALGSSVQSNLSTTTYNSEQVVEIPATSISHLKVTNRVKQTRGVSIFAAIYKRIADQKDYEDSERIAARVGAAFAFAITKSADFIGETTPTSSARFREMPLAPGIIVDGLAAGEGVEQLKNERPANNLGDFRAANLKPVAGATNAGFSTISKNYDGNYGAQRQELLENESSYDILRDEFVSAHRRPIWYDFIDAVRLQGLVDFSNADQATIYNAEHRGGWTPYIDPQREAAADIALVQAGLASKTSVILKRGENPEVVYAQRVDEIAQEKKDGVIFSSNAGNKATPTSTPQTTGGGESGGGSSPKDPSKAGEAEDEST